MKIFFSAGTQLPFNRLRKVAETVAMENPSAECVFQGLGESGCKVANLKGFEFVSPDVFKKIVSQSDVVVSHAGMGNIINFVDMNKDVIIFPRKEEYGEHRNNHQLDTALAIKEKVGIEVVYDVAEANVAIRSKLCGAGCFSGYDLRGVLSRRRKFSDNLEKLIVEL